jgi:hypothetical protein
MDMNAIKERPEFVSTFETEFVGVLFYYCTGVLGEVRTLSIDVCLSCYFVKFDALFGFSGVFGSCISFVS